MASTKKTQNLLLWINALKIILTIFSTTFFTSYIIALNPDNIFGNGILNIAIFYISQYFFYIIIYFLISKFLTNFNKVRSFRIGIIVNGLLLLTIILLGDNISKWIVLAGALIGCSDAFYNANYLVLKNDSVKYTNINKFNIFTSILTNAINIVVPIILGFVIDITSYSYISIYIIFIVLLQLVLSYFLTAQSTQHKFSTGQFVKVLKEDKFAWSKIKYTYYNGIFAGFKNTYKALIIILTIYAFNTNLSLGFLTSIFSIITTILLILFKRYEYHKRMNRLAIYMIISILPIVCAIFFVVFESKISLIFLNLALTIAIQFSEYTGNCERDTIIKNLNLKDFIPEHQFFVELSMCVCRIFSYGLFVIVGLLHNIILFRILLFIMLGMNPIKFIFMYKQHLVRKELEIKFQNEKPTNIS